MFYGGLSHMPGVYSPCDTPLLYQTVDAINTSGLNIFNTTPRFNVSVNYLWRFSCIFHISNSTTNNWFKVYFVVEFNYRYEEKHTLGNKLLYQQGFQQNIISRTFISPKVSNLFQVLQLQFMGVCFTKHQLFLV